MGSYAFGFIGLALFYAAFAMGNPTRSGERVLTLAQILPDTSAGEMASALAEEHPMLQGEYADTQSLASDWCSTGAWSYRLNVSAPLNNLDMDLQEDNSLNVRAALGDIEGRVDGTLRNRLTFCREIAVGTAFGADGAQVTAKVTFLGDPSDINNAQVRIQSTHLERIHLMSWVPSSIEDLVTDVANRGLESLWSSRLGAWIGDYISKKIKVEGGERHLPEARARML